MKKVSWLIIFQLLVAGNFFSTAQTPLMPRDKSIQGPQTFAIILGISKYKFVRPLKYADKDAELFRDYLRSPAGGSVKEDNIFCLLNEKANNSNFWGKGFQWLTAKNLQKNDKLFIYLAGHGDAIDEDQFFFLGYDCNPAGDKNNYLVSGAIQLFNLKKKIAAITAKGVDVVFIMDACRSSELPGGSQGQSFLNTAISEKKVGEIIMLATAAGQEALEDATIGNGHGLFTYYLVDGLTGLADSKNDPDNTISFREIENYVDLNVPQVAQQIFKKKQDPFFCCSEKNDQIISRVDSIYLRDWLRRKKATEKTPGNSFNEGGSNKKKQEITDTSLITLYNLFYQAIRVNDNKGRNDAAAYYNQLEKKFPGNTYTLDARSTLAVTYLDFAQEKVDEYLGCNNSQPDAEIKEAGERLEKAIELFSYEDADFANSLMNRLYFLKASTGNSNEAFQNAWSAKNINPAGAYILNKLALMHLENRNTDSALYYATRAMKIAPNWNCAANTFSLVKAERDSLSFHKNINSKKIAIGMTIGGGITVPTISFSKANWRQGNINYNDSLNNITTSSGGRFDLGAFFYLNLGRALSWRPAVVFVYEGGKVDYEKKSATGAEPVFVQRKADRLSINLPMSFIFKFSQKDISPYLVAGPIFSYALPRSDNADPSQQVRVSKDGFDLQGEIGIGMEMRAKRNMLIISPEFTYSQGFSNMKGNGNNLYLNTISELKKKAFVFNICFRKG